MSKKFKLYTPESTSWDDHAAEFDTFEDAKNAIDGEIEDFTQYDKDCYIFVTAGGKLWDIIPSDMEGYKYSKG